MVWSFTLTFLLYLVLRYFHLERVTQEQEEIGTDYFHSASQFLGRLIFQYIMSGLDFAVHFQAAYDDLKPKLNDKPTKTGRRQFNITNSALVRNDVPLRTHLLPISSSDNDDGFVVVHRERSHSLAE